MGCGAANAEKIEQLMESLPCTFGANDVEQRSIHVGGCYWTCAGGAVMGREGPFHTRKSGMRGSSDAGCSYWIDHRPITTGHDISQIERVGTELSRAVVLVLAGQETDRTGQPVGHEAMGRACRQGWRSFFLSLARHAMHSSTRVSAL